MNFPGILLSKSPFNGGGTVGQNILPGNNTVLFYKTTIYKNTQDIKMPES